MQTRCGHAGQPRYIAQYCVCVNSVSRQKGPVVPLQVWRETEFTYTQYRAMWRGWPHRVCTSARSAAKVRTCVSLALAQAHSQLYNLWKFAGSANSTVRQGWAAALAPNVYVLLVVMSNGSIFAHAQHTLPKMGGSIEPPEPPLATGLCIKVQ